MHGFILDLDGTIYSGQRPIPHAAAFVQTLQERGWPYVFATNNSSRTPEQVVEHLRHVTGIPAETHQVLSTAQAAARYVSELNVGKSVYMIGETGLRQALMGAGFQLVDEEDCISNVDFVIQGIDRSFHYNKLATAVRYIQSGATFVLTNPDHLLPADGEFYPGAGSIGASIQAASGQIPIIIGKPSPIMMRYAADRIGLPHNHIWAVGDNIRTDIGGGAAAGCRTALVLTGLATRDNLQSQIEAAGIIPDLVSDNLTELLQRLS